MKRPLIVAANWKMNGGLALIEQMTNAFNGFVVNDNVEIVICPSFPYLAAFTAAAKTANLNEHIHLGAQNVSAQENGAFTGEVSTGMLKDVSVSYVIVGHSERRSLYSETSVVIAEKVKSVLEAGLTPILCIGESEAQRVAEQTNEILASQLQAVIDIIGIEKFVDVVVAYEPVWAIGTGKTASPNVAQKTHQFIRQFLTNIDADVANKVPLLYGGSLNATTSEELFAQTDIDGGLIGGASLKVDEFKVICSTAKGI
ncbi:MAG: triose-phosphate isomerase [Alteromonadaceae bacterium]|jgi:triosephosphate isomerase|tara:strand:+ start:679 stop:1449 length:771 start_codon:yes stop_codon:yes gene_type:complete